MKPELILCLSCPTLFQAGAQISKVPSVTSHTPLMHVYTYASHAVSLGTLLGSSFWLALGSSLLSLWWSAFLMGSDCKGHGLLWALRQDFMKLSGF